MEDNTSYQLSDKKSAMKENYLIFSFDLKIITTFITALHFIIVKTASAHYL